uniref:Uncharacterized protein n=1 Tax=Caenorhabditis japonica TaxID=281687 RepID=A0A8R1EL53_CAEJA
MKFTPGKQLTAFILDLEYLLYRTYRTRILRTWVEEQLYKKIPYSNLILKEQSYPKNNRTQRYRTQIWYPKSSRTQRAIVPKGTVPKIGTQRVAVPKDPSYPKSLGPKDPGPTEYWPIWPVCVKVADFYREYSHEYQKIDIYMSFDSIF